MKLPATNKQPRPASIVAAAFIVELGFGGLAILLGWLFGLSPVANLVWDAAALAWGVATSLPLLAALWLAVNYPIGPLRSLRWVVSEWIVPMFGHCNWVHLALISAAAGLGEELFFRGFLQVGLARWTASPVAGLVLASLLFGLAHPITWLYFVVAGLIGLYLGGLWIATDNLVVPITTHAVYDFGAFLYLVRQPGATCSDSIATEGE